MSDNVHYTIYCHVFPNGKRYIGITKTSLEMRWDNGRGYKTCILVNRAIEKYGWNNVKHEILGETFSKEDAEAEERKYIALFNTTDPTYGYNILPGGDVSVNDATDEMKYKLGNGWRGKHRSEEEKQKIANGVKKRFERKESNGHFGMKHSEEAKLKMSNTHIEQWKNDGLRIKASERMKNRFKDEDFKEKVLANLRKHAENTSKPVLQYTRDGKFVKRWLSISEIVRSGFSNHVGDCCRHKRNFSGGFIWEFENQTEKDE